MKFIARVPMPVVLLCCSMILAILFFWSLTRGVASISLRNAISWMVPWMTPDAWKISSEHVVILKTLRLPRILLAMFAGGALAVAGAVFQALLKNPLADPYILGISGGSAFVAVLCMVALPVSVFVSFAVIPLGAFLGGLGAIVLVYSIAGPLARMSSLALLLAGVMVNSLFSALILFVYALADPSKLQNILFWVMGDLSGYTRHLAVLCAVITIGALYLLTQARALNLLCLGDESAAVLGIDVIKTRRWLFLVTSVMIGMVVSASGLIGFVGMVVPHTMRLFFGSDHRLLLPASLVSGASFLLLSDTFARTLIAPVELPVGAITALIGAPVFIFLMRHSARRLEIR